MQLELIHARILALLKSEGSILAVAKKLRRSHTSVLYFMKSLESETGLRLFDRTGYRTRLTPVGESLNAELSYWLVREQKIEDLVYSLRTGYERDLAIVYDGSLPLAPIIHGVEILSKKAPHCRVSLHMEYLSGVQEKMRSIPMSMGLSVVKPIGSNLSALKIGSQRMEFVGKKSKQGPVIVVKGVDEGDQSQLMIVGDFHSKRELICAGLGVGWMPSHLVESDIRTARLIAHRKSKVMDLFLLQPQIESSAHSIRELFIKTVKKQFSLC